MGTSRPLRRAVVGVWLIALTGSALACASDGFRSSSSGGAGTSGSSSGGTTSTGTGATGGAIATTGGRSGAGGVNATGGASAAANGGSATGATGGAAGNGASTTGGSVSTGGVDSNGGATAVVGSGGAPVCPSGGPCGGAGPQSGTCLYGSNGCCTFTFGNSVGSCVCSYSSGSGALYYYGNWSCALDCPATKPDENSACDVIATSTGSGGTSSTTRRCAYGPTECRCGSSASGWDCSTCPSTTPQHGSDCSTSLSGLDCAYPNGTCQCLSGAWSCTIQCPAAVPTSGSACNGTSTCNYGLSNCTCQSGVWACRSCPPSPPVANDQCANYLGEQCRYADRECNCNGSWSCWGTCPTSAPADGSACGSMQAGLPCGYGSPESERCTCDASTLGWHCLTCPSSAPANGSDCTGYPVRTCNFGPTSCSCGGAFWQCSP